MSMTLAWQKRKLYQFWKYVQRVRFVTIDLIQLAWAIWAGVEQCFSIFVFKAYTGAPISLLRTLLRTSFTTCGGYLKSLETPSKYMTETTDCRYVHNSVRRGFVHGYSCILEYSKNSCWKRNLLFIGSCGQLHFIDRKSICSELIKLLQLIRWVWILNTIGILKQRSISV